MGTHPIFESDFDCLTEKRDNMVLKIESAEKFNQEINGDTLVCVDFFATWCGPCRMIAPYLEELSKELEDLAAQQEVKAMPTFSFFKGGKKLESFAGANKERIRSTNSWHELELKRIYYHLLSIYGPIWDTE